MLLNRKREPLRMAEALVWSVSWGAGAAIGVALGGWLTLVGGSGAPGATGLDPVSDLVVLPAAAFGSVVLVHIVGQLVVAALRGRAVSRSHEKRDDQRGEHNGVTG